MKLPPTVFVVDDNVGVRNSLRALFESAELAVETFATTADFLLAYDASRPGCLVLDIRLQHENGLDLQDELHRRHDKIPVIVLTGHANVPTSVRALKAGAADFLQKPTPPKILVERVLAAIEKDLSRREAMHEHDVVKWQLEHLTPRERLVMELLIEGKASKEIASDLDISVRTVEGHRRMVFSKMNVFSAAQLVRTVLDAHEAGEES